MPPLQKTGVGSHRMRPFFMAILCIAGGRQKCRPYRKPASGRIAYDRFLWRSYASLAGGKNAAPTENRRGVASHATVFYGDPMHRWRAAKMPPLQRAGEIASLRRVKNQRHRWTARVLPLQCESDVLPFRSTANPINRQVAIIPPLRPC